MSEEDIRREAIQRHVIGGEAPRVVCKSINRSKQWFFKWLKRYKTGAADWYQEHSRAPKTSPTAITPETRDRIILTRQHLEASPYAQIGVSAIKWELKKLGTPFPSDRTIQRVVKDEGLVKKNSPTSAKELSIPISRRPYAATTSIKWTSWDLVISKTTADSIR
jgi:putative transposase